MPILLSGTWRGETDFHLNAERKYLGAKQFLSYLIQKRILSNLPNKSYAHKPHLQECKQNCLSIYHRPPTNRNALLSLVYGDVIFSNRKRNNLNTCLKLRI